MGLKLLLDARERLQRAPGGFSAILLLITALAYGPLITELGYYWDDWPVISLLKNNADLWSFYSYDRPFSAWTYWLTGPLLGIRPLNWHIFSLILRWLMSVGLWWNLRLLWPQHRRQLMLPVLLFAVYPAFTLQPIAVAFSQHFITYGFFLLSTGWMLAAHRSTERKTLLTGLAIGAQLVHMLTMEYLWGLELVRPLLLGLIPSGASFRERARYALRGWLPYLTVQAGLFIWRVFVLEFPASDPNPLALVELYRTNLFAGLLETVNIVTRDVIQVVYKSWTTSVDPGLIDVTDRSLLFSWIWVVVIAGFVYGFLERRRGMDEPPGERSFYRTMVLLGAAALLLSLLPSWITGNEITVGKYSARYALPALFGGSLIVSGVIAMLFRRQRDQIIVIAVLVGLSAGIHFRNANVYRWDWVKQERFFRQFSQRVPGLEPRTAVYSSGAIFLHVAEYATSFALNTFYPNNLPYPEQSYWFFEIDDNFAHQMEDFLSGMRIRNGLRNIFFQGNSLNGLTIYYEPDTGSCLRVLSPAQADMPDLPALTAMSAAISNPGRIIEEPAFSDETMERIFGPPDAPTWCDFYQQAEIARQNQDWERIVQLEAEAQRLDLSPNNRLEWFPFIEALTMLEEWDAAETRILEAFQFARETRDRTYFCSFWERVSAGAHDDVLEEMDCR